MSNMIQYIPNSIQQETIDEILALPEVNNARLSLTHNSISFTISNSHIQQTLSNLFPTVKFNKTIPLRWIKGDTPSHTDKSANKFTHTFLTYLTDSPGKLMIGKEEYPITKGSSYIFQEGLYHETVGTNDTNRLLLGPLSEQGLQVGAGQIISADGEINTVYLKEDTGNWFYQIDNGGYSLISSFPLYIQNINATPSTYPLKILFTTDLTITNTFQYIVCGSEGLQFGDTSLKQDGSRPILTVDNVTNYPGCIQNGSSFSNGYNAISIFNLVVNSINSSTLVSNGGWVGQEFFGKGATTNTIINCSSDGQIIDAGGGIIGGNAATSGGTISIINCSSQGNGSTYSGGIIGYYAGRIGGNVTIQRCWSTGMIGQEGGGIYGYYAGADGGSASCENCYSTGLIDIYAGGIFGRLAGTNGLAISNSSYSRGIINTDGGGIFGSDAASAGGICNATNCYSAGTILTVGNGIYGSNKQPSATQSNCYIADGSWSSTTANTQLQGTPNPTVGTTWISPVINTPYELRNMGYTPYTTTIINSTPDVITSFSQSVVAGNSSIPAIINGKVYTILSTTNNSITINTSSGRLSTTSTTPPGVYTVIIRNSGSYHVSTFVLTVTPSIPCLLKGTLILTPTGYTPVESLKKGDTVLTSDKRRVPIVNIHNTIVKGGPSTYPCVIQKNAVGNKEEFCISQNHLIKYGEYWVLPKTHFKLDKNAEEIHYYHIQLKKYSTDHLVINEGVIVESLAVTREDKIEYYSRIMQKSVTNVCRGEKKKLLA